MATLWPLKSGVWQTASNRTGFDLTTTALKHRVSDQLTVEDVRTIVAAGRLQQQPETLYPPEFNFCPESGEVLQKGARTESQVWVPPYGTADLGMRAGRLTRGLRQTALPLKLTSQAQRRADNDPDATLGLPPPGNYEFLSAPFGGKAPMLLAIDPTKGAIYTLLPHSRRWELLDHETGGLLADTHIDRTDWRCELFCDGLTSRVFLPTAAGLACLRPDVVGLSFDVHYLGNVQAVGAPIQFADHVWVPQRFPDNTIRFISSDSQGEAGPLVELPALSMEIGRVHAPLADGRIALWPCAAGQLLLLKQASGGFDASFQPWPENVQPAFEFGSPYLSRDGALWQLCFDKIRGTYLYLQLGAARPEQVIAPLPRLCSGSFNFRFATKYKSEPWLDPEFGDDGSTNEVILPLLESSSSACVVGLKLTTTAGLAEVLRATERVRVVLILDDGSSETAFHTLAVAEPTRLRLFVHDSFLWAYHPLLSRMEGWRLQS